jgi:hypothetical protein
MMKQVLNILDGDKLGTARLLPLLEKSGLELRGAARENDYYKYRLSPVGEKIVLAHFNTVDEIVDYIKDLLESTG